MHDALRRIVRSVPMYRCFSCKKQVEIEDKVRCSYCGFRILVKERPEIARRVVVK